MTPTGQSTALDDNDLLLITAILNEKIIPYIETLGDPSTLTPQYVEQCVKNFIQLEINKLQEEIASLEN